MARRGDDLTSASAAPLRRLAAGVLGLFLLTSAGLYVCLEYAIASGGGGDDVFQRIARGAGGGAATALRPPALRGLWNSDPIQRLVSAAAARHPQQASSPRDNNQGDFLLPEPSDATSLRREFERHHPPHDMDRLYEAVDGLRVADPATPGDLSYNVHRCPPQPPPGYPHEWNLVQMLTAWNPDDTEIPATVHNALCVFDYATDAATVEAYRRAEVPFVVRHHPDVMRTTERWSQPGYLERLVGPAPQRNEHAAGNHLMFWRTVPRSAPPPSWKPPTDMVELSVGDWMRRADELEEGHAAAGAADAAAGAAWQARQEHWYFRLNAVPGALNEYLYDELPVFRPDRGPSLFMVEPHRQRGINCRFGMRGVIAESHFDPTRNWILLLGGRRRYILSHPRQCPNLELYPLGHPSGRHSAVDWSHVQDHPHLASSPFGRATANEVVLQAGDALYLPTSWFHFIVSLTKNYQCNARSGVTTENHHYLHECGFPVD